MKTKYKTKDFMAVSVLLLRKHPLLSIDASDPRRVYFLFEDSDRLQKDLSLLRRGELLVDPADFWAAERRVKQIIYGGEQL